MRQQACHEPPQTQGSREHDCVSNKTASWAAPVTAARPTVRSNCSGALLWSAL